MKYLLLLFALFFSRTAFCQPVACHDSLKIHLVTDGGDTIKNHLDTLHCGTPCVTIHARVDTAIKGTTTYTLSSVTYAPFSLTTGADVMESGSVMSTIADDDYGDLIPLPFSFCFFGNIYNNVVVGSNGNICFNAMLADSGDPWPISGPLPGSNCAATENCIMGPWNDLLPRSGGTIKYATYGVAPCRQFVVSWNNCALFEPGTCSDFGTQQIVLYEISNTIDVYIAHRASCVAWNSGLAVTAIENNAGTVFYAAPGENGTTFTATNQGWRFTPNTPSPTYAWTDSTRTTVISTSDSIHVCPTVNSRYYVTVDLGCVILNDSVKVILLPGIAIDSTAFHNPSSCIVTDGWILFHGMPPGDSIIVTYLYNGTPVGPILLYPNADSDIVFSSLPGGVYTQFFFTHDSCSIGPFGPFNLIPPPITISHETFTNPDICGQCNGTITLYGLPPGASVTVNYMKDGSPMPPFSGVIGMDSTVHLNGLCAGNYTGIVAAVGFCTANGTPITITNPPRIPASFTFTTQLRCSGDEVIVTNTSTPAGFNAAWSFGDGTPIDTSGAIPLPHFYADSVADSGTYIVTLVYSSYNTCFDTVSYVVAFNHAFTDSFTSDYNAVCVGTPITFTNYSTTVNTLSYLWDYGNGATDSVISPTYTYGVPGIYKTKLTVTDTVGCKKTFSEQIEVISIDVRTGVHDTSVCLPDSMLLRAYISVVPDTVPFTYMWTPTNNIGNDSSATASSNNTYAPTNFLGIGTFIYTITATTPALLANPGGCVASDTQRIISYPPVTFTNLTASPQIIPVGGSIQLNADGAVFYTWTPDNGTLSNPNINDPIATPTDSLTVYTVTGMNNFGCRASADVLVTINYNITQALPSGFSPNGDGLNDVFKITKLKFQKLIRFSVYNRWGQEVFRTTNPEVGWDGTYNGAPQDLGVYFYEVIVGMPEGYDKTYTGDITLIR